MNRLTEETIKQATVGKMMTCQEVSSYSPQEIREAISGLVAEHKTILAEALVEAGLALYPESEGYLSYCKLNGNATSRLGSGCIITSFTN